MITSEKQSESQQAPPPAYGESSGASPNQVHNPYSQQQQPQPQILYPPPGSPYQEGPLSSSLQAYPPQQAQQPWSPNSQAQDPMARDVQIGQNYQAALFARCAQGRHERTTKYGACGIIAAILLFPIGILCLFLDTEDRCAVCGTVL
ncbi:Membrane protein BRI3 [Pleurotus pulmonarius]|nr:hypothetical protein EYR36_004755 [Pleurotus pulmonarius]KAF4578821.1 hypothetical protein EYR36_000628 [Pleurotus pulmonarius]